MTKNVEKTPVVRKIDTISNPNLHVQETGKHNIQINETVRFSRTIRILLTVAHSNGRLCFEKNKHFKSRFANAPRKSGLRNVQFSWIIKLFSHAPYHTIPHWFCMTKNVEKTPVVRKIDTFSNPNLHVQKTGKHNIQIIETVSFFSNHMHLADSRSLKWTPVLREKQTFQIQICKRTLQIWIAKCQFTLLFKQLSNAPIIDSKLGLHEKR